jgi:hypothetical protein
MNVGVVVNGFVVSAAGLVLAWMMHGRFAALEARMDRMEDRLDKRLGGVDKRFEQGESLIEGVRTSLESRIDGVQSSLESRIEGVQGSLDAFRSDVQRSFDGLRSDLTAIALAVGARPRTSQGGSRG